MAATSSKHAIARETSDEVPDDHKLALRYFDDV